MKTTLRITKLELNNLFYSPLAWLILVGFAIFTANEIVPVINHQVVSQGWQNRESMTSLTQSMFTMTRSYYPNVSTLFMVLIPLLAMGVISREASTGSIKLLYSSPIKLSSIIIGKYIAIMVFIVMLMLIILTAVLTAYFSIDLFDIGTAMSGFIGLFFLAASIAAIALYVSTFSEYPIVDAVATIALVFGLSILYNLVKELPLIRDIVYWLSPTKHTNYAIQGLLTSKNIGYFIVLISLFLTWSLYKMQLKRQTIAGKRITRIKMFSALLIGMSLIYFLSQPKFMIYKDMTLLNNNELNPISKKELAELKEKPIKITTYINVFKHDMFGFLPYQQINDKQLFDKYFLEFPQIEMEYVFYYSEEMLDHYLYVSGSDRQGLDLKGSLQKIADLNKLDIDEILPVSELDLPKHITKEYGKLNFRVIESEGKKSVLITKFNDMIGRPQEAQITAAFKCLLQDKFEIAVINGHDERSIVKDLPQDINKLISGKEERHALLNNGFNVSAIGLDTEIPAEIDVLVIADPKTAYSEKELQNYKQFVNRGGNLLLTGEQGRQDILNPLTSYLGVELMPGTVVNDNPAYSADYTLAELNQDFPGNFYRRTIQMPKATAVSLKEDKGFKSTVLLAANEKENWLDLEGPDQFGEIKYQPEEGDKKEKLALALQLERSIKGKQQKIVVSGDTDFLSNGRLTDAPSGIRIANFGLMGGFSSWFTNGEYPLHIPYVEANDKRVQIAYGSMIYLKLLFFLIIPGIFAAFGIRMLIKRMRN